MLFNNAKEKVCHLLYDKINLNDKNIENTLIKELDKENKFTRLELINIFSYNTKLENLDEIKLCVLFQKMSEQYEDIGCDTDYFTSNEIEKATCVVVKSSELKYPLKFENAILVNENQYSVKMSVQLIKQLYDSKLVTRIPEAERESYTKTINNEVVSCSKINKERVKEIKESILSNNYEPDEIKYNLVKNEDSQLIYDNDNKTLTIKKGLLAITDGEHRIIATSNALDENSDIDLNFMVTITHHPIWRMRKTMYQLEHRESMFGTHIDQMANTEENQLVQKIKNSNDLSAFLKDKIVTTNQHVVRGQGVIVFSYLANAIKLIYSNKELTIESDRTAKWLVSYFNALFNILEHKIIDSIGMTKQTTWMYDEVAIYIYAMISKHLQDTENWEERLEKYINSMDFKKSKVPISRYNKNILELTKKYLNEVIFND